MIDSSCICPDCGSPFEQRVGRGGRYERCPPCREARYAEKKRINYHAWYVRKYQPVEREEDIGLQLSKADKAARKARQQRLAAIRAERTARQKACAYGVRV